MKFITIFASLLMFLIGGTMIVANEEDPAEKPVVVVECVEDESTEEIECPPVPEDESPDEEVPASDE